MLNGAYVKSIDSAQPRKIAPKLASPPMTIFAALIARRSAKPGKSSVARTATKLLT